MHTTPAWFAALSLAVLSVLSFEIAEHTEPESPASPSAARTVAAVAGLVDPGPVLVTHSPWIEERGVAHDGATVRIVFDRALDGSTVGDRTVRLGIVDARGRFEPVRSRVRLAHGGREILVRPLSPLSKGIYHHVRLRGGPEGVRAADGGPLAEEYRWRFATGLAFGSGPGRGERGRMGACYRPPLTGGAPSTIVVHVYQTSCNTPVLPGKRALIRAYAPWYALTGSAAPASQDQLEFFDADIEFAIDGGSIGKTSHRFYRTDSDGYAKLQKSGRNSALFWNWSPSGGSGAASVSATVVPTDGNNIRVSPGATTFDWWQWQPDREDLEILIYTLSAEGPGAFAQPAFTDVTRLADKVAEMAEQMLPIRSATWFMASDARVGAGTSHPLRSVPRSGSESYLCGVAQCPRTDQVVRWSELDATGAAGRTDIEPVFDFADAIIAAAAGFGPGSDRTARKNNVLIGIAPRALMGLNAGAVTVPTAKGKVIITPAEGPPEAVLHEIGHRFGLKHCPFPTCDCYCGGGCRSSGCEIEGYKLDQEAPRGWNKSMTEGNGETADAAPPEPIMFYSLSRPLSDGLSSGTRSSTERRFMSASSYLQLLTEFGNVAPAPAPEPEPLRLRLPDAPVDATPDAPGESPVPSYAGFAPCDAAENPLAATETPFSLGVDRAVLAQLVSDIRIRRGRTVQSPGPTLLVRGKVRADGTDIELIEAAIDTGGVTLPLATLAVVPGLVVVTMDAAGTVLESAPVVLPVLEPADDIWLDPAAAREFIIALDAPAIPGDLARVAIVDANGSTRATLARSPNAPSIRWIDPQAGDRIDDRTVLRWSAQDADGDGLVFTLEARHAPTDPWLAVVSSWTTDRVNMSDIALTAGAATELRVLASDGFNRTTSHAVRVNVRRAPVVTAQLGDSSAVPVESVVRVAFNTPMDPASIDANSFQLRDAQGRVIPAQVVVEADARAARLIPDAPLRAGVDHTLWLRSSASDPWGNRLGADHTWTLRTTADTDAPWVMESLPAPGAFTVDPAAGVRVWFDEDLDPATIDANTVRVEQNGSVVHGTLSWDDTNRSIVFHPSSPYAMRATVIVTIDGVTDLSGNPLDAPHVFRFTIAGRVVPAEQPQGVLR